MSSSSAEGPHEAQAGAPERFSFQLPGRLEYRDAARAFLAHVCDHLSRAGRLPADAGHRVISAFVEAFNNAVIHAYEGRDQGPVQVELEVAPQHLTVRVIDEGQPFVPEDVPEPNLAALPEGGLGLFIIRNFMDQVRYERVHGRNVLTMVKAFDAPDGAAEA
ncbi:MAG: ATP-binding protein [Myxococcales bacterium]|nr:ATP-binding protein [Myxococcales bacterium]MCB9646176.1 ATP-binding protein [Deltaproteobacteria bacterium]